VRRTTARWLGMVIPPERVRPCDARKKESRRGVLTPEYRGGSRLVQVAAQIAPNLGGAYITTDDPPQRKISRRIALC
jgi:hypothetical protein